MVRFVVFGLFLFSGVSGLIYEVVWSRMFSTVLGTTVYAVATVLGVFMGGLALGSWLFGRLADRPGAHGLRIYGWLEVAIGAYAIALPLLMSLSNTVYRAIWPLASDSGAGLLALRVVLASVILIVPSTLMGGTLPVLSRFLVRSHGQSGREIGLLYALNTLGAVCGVLLSGFVLLETIGVTWTLVAGAIVSTSVGVVALMWAGRVEAPPLVGSGEGEALPAVCGPKVAKTALAIYALSGFTALALEVLWTRSLMYFVSVDTWAFSSMLAAFLLGLGLGSLVFSPLAGRVRNPVAWLGAFQCLAGVTAAASVLLFGLVYELQTSAASSLAGVSPLLQKAAVKLACSVFVMLVPTLFMGMSFPLVSRIWITARGRVGSGLGTLYALNTMGAIAGSVAAGFALIPILGIQTSILACGILYVLGGGVLLLADRARPLFSKVILVAAPAATLLLALVTDVRPVVTQSHFFKQRPGEFQTLFVDEGVGASLAVLENRNGTRLLNINGVTTAADNFMDMQVHRMLSHLPMLLHPQPRKVLVVGFGMGSTVWGCCQHDAAERVDVVELLRAERQTAAFFEHVNHRVLGHAKIRFIVEDGRNYLLATRERYDVISFNAVHPRFSANLYTEDFYELCRERLTDNGVVCAWMTQNSMTDAEWRGLCASLVRVFPHSSLWYCNPQHFCLIGSVAPHRVDLDDWRRRVDQPQVKRDLADSCLANPLVLATRYMFGTAALRSYVAGAQPNTDDLPIIEFSREDKSFERTIIEKLADMVTSVREIRDGMDPKELAAHEASAGWVVQGQIEYWYPTTPLLSEILYKRALLAAPQSQDARHYLGFSDLLVSRVRRLRRENPGNPALARAWARILREQGRLDEAEKELAQLLQNHPDVPALADAAIVRWLRDDAKGCLEITKEMVNVELPDQDLRLRLLWAHVQASKKLGRSTEVRAIRDELLRVAPRVEEWFELSRKQARVMASTK